MDSIRAKVSLGFRADGTSRGALGGFVSEPFAGVRVVEVAGWTFVPGAGAIIADLGGDVIKVEPPGGDPQRGLGNMLNRSLRGPNPFVEIPNRGKRSITLDLASADGRAIMLRLVAAADVFLTSYLERPRQRLGIDVGDLQAVNPRLIYVRGSGYGPRGPLTSAGGYDSAASWTRGGSLARLTPPGSAEPIAQPPAFFDLQGSNSLAGAIAMALFRRERTGEGAVVDVSLLASGMWPLSPDIVAAPFLETMHRHNRSAPGNPIVNYYRTSDDRWVNLVCLQADRFWAELCRVIGRPELADDERFTDATVRSANSRACVAELDQVFAQRTLAEWKEVLSTFSGVWAPAQDVTEMYEDPQVAANGYLPEVTANDGTPFRVVAPPYQFDERPSQPPGPAPEAGQHTEEVLLSLGYQWDEITAYREKGALG
jgi:crotonobetainyl-CoA:carnitine CoA-transferase CaiB-like acyl-CoA transferase